MAEPDKALQEKINKLSTMEHSLQNFLAQKQAFQAQLLELTSALDELKKTDQAYRIVGNVMVRSDKDSLTKELEEKKEMLDIRIRNLDKQESKMREKTSELQSEVMEEMSEK